MKTLKHQLRDAQLKVRQQENDISLLKAEKERLRSELASCAKVLELNSGGTEMLSVVSAKALLDVTK